MFTIVYSYSGHIWTAVFTPVNANRTDVSVTSTINENEVVFFYDPESVDDVAEGLDELIPTVNSQLATL